MTSQFSIVTTRDGALAVHDTESGEVMHPVVGPAIEAQGLYAGPSQLSERLAEDGPELVVLDVGLGAGSNAGLAWRISERERSGRGLRIISFDRTTEAMSAALDHDADAFLLGEAARRVIADGFADGHNTRWEMVVGELPATLAARTEKADVVFWDPFSPKANPTLWTPAVFRILREQCSDRASVHTYSSSTAIRSALLLAGFWVGRGPGVGSKRETTIAATEPALLTAPLTRRFLDRLGRSSAPLPEGSPSDAMEQIRSHPQFSCEHS